MYLMNLFRSNTKASGLKADLRRLIMKMVPVCAFFSGTYFMIQSGFMGMVTLGTNGFQQFFAFSGFMGMVGYGFL